MGCTDDELQRNITGNVKKYAEFLTYNMLKINSDNMYTVHIFTSTLTLPADNKSVLMDFLTIRHDCQALYISHLEVLKVYPLRFHELIHVTDAMT